jgi:hypothetical protein
VQESNLQSNVSRLPVFWWSEIIQSRMVLIAAAELAGGDVRRCRFNR